MLANLNVIDFIAKTKSASEEDTGTFEVCISTNDIDRHGDVIDQNGWSFERYMKNPVVLWGHDYWSLPIGITEGIRIEEGKTIATGKFAPESANPFAQQVRKLYDAGIVRATSVGFIATEEVGNLITKAELLEFSFVPVPANPYALDMRKALELGVDTGMLAMKGIAVKEDEEAVTTDETPAPATEDVVETKPEEEATTEETEVAKVLGQIMARLDALEKCEETTETNDAVGETAEGADVDGGEKANGGDFDDWKAVQSLCRSGVTAMTNALTLLNERSKKRIIK